MKHYASNIVGLDLDGVIIDHTKNRLVLARRFGYRLKPQQTASDVFRRLLPIQIKRKIQKYLYDDPAFGLRPPLVRGALTGLRFLKKRRTPYFLVSRRKKPSLAIKLLKKRGLWPAYFDRRNAFFVETKQAKNHHAKRLRVSVYLDDQPSVLEELKAVKHKFLFDHRWAYNGFKGDYKKVYSWIEFLRELKKLL
jgi:hypothetical protein